jgi:hypothetical protein
MYILIYSNSNFRSKFGHKTKGVLMEQRFPPLAFTEALLRDYEITP